MMTDAHRLAMLAGQWFPVRPSAARAYRIRRLVCGHFETHGSAFLTEEKAQKQADKLNKQEGR